MRKFKFNAVLNLLAAIWILAGFGAAHAQADPDLDPVVDATVRVDANSTGRKGTGWVIQATDNQNRAGAAIIITSLNIIEGSSSITVREPKSGSTFDAIVLESDTDRNLVFLEVKDIEAKPIPISIAAPKIGRSVWTAGYNSAADRSETARAANASITRGSLSREYRGPISKETRANVNQLEYDASMIPGFEGGPLIDRCGRAIGINMKSAGNVVRRSRMRIDPDAKIMNALKSDEIVAFANSAGVKFVPQDGECGSSTAVAAQPDSSKNPPVKAKEPAGTSGFNIIQWLQTNLLLVALLLLGLIAAGFGIFTLTRKSEGMEEENMREDYTVLPAGSRASTEVEGDTVMLGDTRAPTTKEQEIRLSGRGPEGEAIDIRFKQSELATKAVMLGVGTNADEKIPDNRSDHKVSRMHARIGHNGSEFFVEDNKSLNGTKVGSKKIDPHTNEPLVHGDTISLADIELKVSIL